MAQIRAKGQGQTRTAGTDRLGDKPWSFVRALMLLTTTRGHPRPICRR
jgi:hypothetical protein